MKIGTWALVHDAKIRVKFKFSVITFLQIFSTHSSAKIGTWKKKENVTRSGKLTESIGVLDSLVKRMLNKLYGGSR